MWHGRSRRFPLVDNTILIVRPVFGGDDKILSLELVQRFGAPKLDTVLATRKFSRLSELWVGRSNADWRGALTTDIENSGKSPAKDIWPAASDRDFKKAQDPNLDSPPANVREVGVVIGEGVFWFKGACEDWFPSGTRLYVDKAAADKARMTPTGVDPQAALSALSEALQQATIFASDATKKLKDIATALGDRMVSMTLDSLVEPVVLRSGRRFLPVGRDLSERHRIDVAEIRDEKIVVHITNKTTGDFVGFEGDALDKLRDFLNAIPKAST